VKDLSSLIGRIAVTNSEMSPKGTILIGDEVYDAETEGEYLDPGRGVKVTRVKGKKIIVKRV
jgi:membrane-bound serine protease (ClpP class)